MVLGTDRSFSTVIGLLLCIEDWSIGTISSNSQSSSTGIPKLILSSPLYTVIAYDLIVISPCRPG
nr:MAG TPA: hypothetical protein [Caudoviricetes sp.]